jgi:beta-glucosidase/6-phospho-beta-glucosidase/beta-galactosidase
MEGRKGLSIWDVFAHTPGKIVNGETGDVACDHYHLWKQDIAYMKSLGLQAYRFSIAWTRIQPSGKEREANPEGVKFYNQIIDELLVQGIVPYVTLYHWDLPAALQMEDDGWLSEKMVDYFAHYARLCYKHFGDRVKNWITLNEAWVISILGYGQGIFAPGRVSNTEPYIAGHNLLLTHAEAVAVYRTEFKQQGGVIGITNNCDWREPLTDSPEDKEAAEVALEFFLAWFADPIYFGHYPPHMVSRLGAKLPTFTPEQRAKLKGSSDFFGLNHYTTMYVRAPKPGEELKVDIAGNGGISDDQKVVLSVDPSWKKTTMGWAVVPWGFT